jgi:nitrate reductase gamma subunit
MDGMLEFAKGPLFGVSILVMVLGLARHVAIQVHGLLSFRGDRMRQVRWKKILQDTMSWVLPVRHLVPGTILMSIASFTFHVGVIIVPLWLADHIILWEGLFGVSLPRLIPFWADLLTLMTIGAGIALLGYRLLTRRTRAMSRFSDYLILGMVLLPFVTGFLASHPRINPFSWQPMMLTHILSAEALFIVVPFSKLSHIVLFPFNRLSEVHWQLRPGAGDNVAKALYGEEARV